MQRLTPKTIIIDDESDDKPELTITDLLLRNDIKNLTFDQLLEIILKNPLLIKNVPPSVEFYEELCKIAVGLNGVALQHVKCKTFEICKIAINNTCVAFPFIDCTDEQAIELALMAVSRDVYALYFIPAKYHTFEVCETAINQNIRAAKFARNLDEILVLRVLETKPKFIKKVRNPSYEVCIKVLSKNPSLIKHISNPSTDIVEYVLDIDVMQVKHLKNPPIDKLTQALIKNPHLMYKMRCEITADIFQIIVDNHPYIAKTLILSSSKYRKFEYLVKPDVRMKSAKC